MNHQLLTLALTAALLTVLLGLLALRLVRLYARRVRHRMSRTVHSRDLLVETLRERTLGEREALLEGRLKDQALEALHALHHAVIDQAPVGLLAIDAEGGIQFANRAAAALMERDELTGAVMAELNPDLAKAVERLRAQDEHGETELALEIGARLRRWSLSLRSLPGGLLLLTVLDKTLERELEERLRAKRDLELMGEMATGIAHEVKNALAAIRGNAQLLDRGDPAERGGRIKEECDRLLRFVRSFMKSSRDEAIHAQPIDLAAWLAEAAARWRDRPNGSRVVFEPAPADLAISGDASLLAGALDNLILNAVQACETRALNGPWARIWVEAGRDRVAVAVEDKGPGFSESARRKLFTPFVTGKEGGAGLGLFHSRKIVLAHGGRLEIQPGPPTRALCWFPRLVPADAPEPPLG